MQYTVICDCCQEITGESSLTFAVDECIISYRNQGENNVCDTSIFYNYAVKSEFGEITVVWRYADKKVVRVFLPKQRGLFNSSVYKSSRVRAIPAQDVGATCRKMMSLLTGEKVHVSLTALDWSMTYPFQMRVLRMEHRIPHGMVSTYGRLAHKLGHPRAARAVGTALARNPFPIIIPCHRTIRSDRSLGGYAGGLAMKRELLELEGLEFDRQGRVVTDRLW